MDTLGMQATLAQFRHLIFHERDQGADHKRGPAKSDGGQLVAKRLAGAGWHHNQSVAPGADGAANGILASAKFREAKSFAQDAGESFGGKGGGHGASALQSNEAAQSC